jgi:hypothetical protein
MKEKKEKKPATTERELREQRERIRHMYKLEIKEKKQ